MSQDEVPPEAIKAMMAQRKKIVLLALPPFLFMCWVAAMAATGAPTVLGKPALSVAFICLFYFAVVGFFLWKIWRCPACSKSLGLSMPGQCSHCQAMLG